MQDTSIQLLETELAAAQAALEQRDQWIRLHLLEKRKADDRHHALQDELSAYRHSRGILFSILARVQQSPSWRWMAPFRFALSLLRTHGTSTAELIPGVVMEAQKDGSWNVSGAMPQFLLPIPPVCGWVRVQFSIQSRVRSRAQLYWDSGALFNEAERIDLGPVANDTTREFLFYLPRPAFCFRLDPIRKPGQFKIQSFSITPLDVFRVTFAAARLQWQSKTLGKSLALIARGKLSAVRKSFRATLDEQRPDQANEYDLWRTSHALTPAQREAHTRWEKSLADPPLLSVILPTYNTLELCLRECVESVLGQTYQNWELCVADDASTDAWVKTILDSLSSRDLRIKVTYRKSNGNISAASNTALESARGSHIVLLDHDDKLAPQALHAVAQRLVADPLLDMLYSDEDKLTPDGRHTDPFFKPDWSPDFFLSCMYTSHLSVYRTSLVRELGGFRSEFDGSQDYDLALRFVNRISPARIAHIPDILYHWRMLPTSTASGPQAKTYTWAASRRAIECHFQSAGIQATVDSGPSHGLHHVRYTLPGRPKVTVIIPSACRPLKPEDEKSSSRFWAKECIESVREHSTYDNFEFIVAVPPKVPKELCKWFDVNAVQLVHYDVPFNFSQACNAAAAIAQGSHLLFLNDDTLVRSADFIEQMLSLSQRPEVGAVGAALYFPDGRLQHAGVLILDGNPCHAFENYPGGHAGYFGSSSLIRNWSAVTGACLMTRREAFDAIGGFDLAFAMNYGDVDFCLRLIESGYRIVCNPRAELIHHASASSDGNFPHEMRLYKERWGSRWATDPFYNVNLSTRSNDFRIEG